MQALINYKKNIIVGLIVLLIGLLLFLIYFNTIVFRVTSTIPSNNGKVNLGQSVVIFNFTKDIESIDTKNQISASSDIVLLSKTSNKKLIVYVNNIKDGTKYKIEIKNIRSKSGDMLNSVSLYFTGAYIPAGEENSEVVRITSEQTDQGPDWNNPDPIAKALPIITSEYSLDYVILPSPNSKGNKISIRAVLLLPDYELSNTAMIKDYKNKALNYLKSKNINPNDYVIEWVPESAASL